MLLRPQHVDTGELLMQAFADRAAVSETLQSGLATFYSRSRRGRWCKVRCPARLLRESGSFGDYELCWSQYLSTCTVGNDMWHHSLNSFWKCCCGVPLACETRASTQACVPPACMLCNLRCLLKGETSGHYINVASVFPDCDRDSLVYLGDPIGPACHTVSSRPQLLPSYTSHCSGPRSLVVSA